MCIRDKQKVTLVRTWQASDRGIEAELDEDGVAALQIDPGAPVNIVIPAVPFRPVAPPPALSRGNVQELVSAEGASLADQVEIDKWLAPLAPCAKWVTEAVDEVTVGLRVDRTGTILVAGSDPSPLARCIVDTVRTRRLPAGEERMLAVPFHVTDPALPKLVPGFD